ncbi:DUF4268 domain-containing protein [uncultured Moraxella sp.]|uniref:DUF4268 domain-containing protein n=1 Tax=uncultured Moraxella sp. TaxID=263769 RepID=UPI002600191F|nr:DUF4268 domain-containing protein [uncultured Moraxella sp.]
MFSINQVDNSIEKIQPTSFSELGFSERNHLQEWIAKNPAALGEELLIIQKEFDGFDDTRERLDLLALDKQGDLVIIENKLDDSGRNVTWQALKYASYCATLTKSQIIDIYQSYLGHHSEHNAEHEILKFLRASDLDEVRFNQNQRIIFVANHYRKEVTSTVLWLMTKHEMPIQCFKATPYKFGEQIFLDMEQIIPIKETEEFMIKMAEKNREEQNMFKERDRLLLDFWQTVIDRCKQAGIALFANAAPSKFNNIGTGIGITGLSVNFVMTRNTGRIELYISKNSPEENTRIFNELLKSQDMIQQELGYELIWESLDDKKACRIKAELSDVGTFDQQTWDAAINFFVGNVQKFYDVFKKHLANIN